MKRRFASLVAAAILATALATVLFVAPAGADFGLSEFDVSFANEGGSPELQAGSHPFAFTTKLALNATFNPEVGDDIADGDIKDLTVGQIPGLVGNPTATPRCPAAEFLAPTPACSRATAVGHTRVTLSGPTVEDVLVYNLVPPPGVAQKLGFAVLGAHVALLVRLSPNPPYNVLAEFPGTIPQVIPFLSSQFTLWGNPADPAHDAERGGPANIAETPYLTVPRACGGALETSYETDSWQAPGVFVKGSAFTHDDATPPNPQGFIGCGKLGFKPSIVAQPTTKAAESPTGLDFSLNVNDEGLTSPNGIANSDIEKAVVTLPEGMSVNPSIAEGLSVCSEADLARESALSAPGAGCLDASKIGTVEVETPLLDESVDGALYQAAPYENPFHSLIALYMVIKNPTLGIVVRQPLKVEPDPVTGRLTTVAEGLPQLPFSHFKLHFREGTRSPLASPPACGTYDAEATLYPWSGGPPVTTTSAFEIITGPDAGPCPTGGTPPFHPGLIAGTLNNAGGRFSPFNVRLSRTDSEQEITHFSIKLPPGITGKLAGIPFCPDAAIAAAKARTGPHGGQEELDAPSCPAASEIGHTLVGSGVGSALAYAPGKLYLAGAYRGSPLSLVAITSGVVGPFDIGTVVVREAFQINPETAEVFIDSTGSDPIPHIIQGIPVHLRDIRAYTDRPEFVLNPSSCARTSTASTLLGAGLDFGSEADDSPITVSTPFQAADCAALPFKPRLSFRLIGGTRRGAHPKLKATLKMNGIGEAAISRASVTLPHSEFLENAHIKTICTRVQFAAGAGNGAGCPAGSIYGYAKAATPILSDPLEGPVFLRSSEHQLPDLVAALHSPSTGIDFDLVGRIDSVKGGGIRNTFATVPDAPVSSATFTFQGAGKSLLVNSTNLCQGTHRATVELDGHNGKSYDTHPALQAKCGKKHHKRAKRVHR